MQKTWILAIAVFVSLWIFPLMPIQSEAQSALPLEVAKHGYADMIVVNGNLVSVDDARCNGRPGSIFEAMAIKGNRRGISSRMIMSPGANYVPEN